jgi:hypothetical protein
LGITSKFAANAGYPPKFAANAGYPPAEILRGAHMPVCRQGVSPDDQVLNAVGVERG